MSTSQATPEDLARALDVARRELLEAMAGLTERDFATDLGEGVTIVALLADLARAEHLAIAQARAAAGLEPRPTTEVGASAARPLPPQVTHALAGTRYEARLLLDALAPGEAVAPTIAAPLLEGCAAAEHDAATRIAARPTSGPDQPPPRLQLA
ncbi:MAG: hypothetical protein IT299_11440 [Dehalococcoidia bacterium]|nr:hypothetical protein [Dehalococcoidia bacterium]